MIDINGAQQSVPYSAFDRTYDTNFMLDQAFSLGRAPNLIQQVQEQLRVLLNGVDVDPQVTWNGQAAGQPGRRDRGVGPARSGQRDLIRVDGHYVVTPAQTGLVGRCRGRGH